MGLTLIWFNTQELLNLVVVSANSTTQFMHQVILNYSGLCRYHPQVSTLAGSSAIPVIWYHNIVSDLFVNIVDLC